MEFCSLFSGSSGNCLFIKHNHTRLLCDAGKNGKQVERALAQIGEDASKINGIIITHEHSDHISAAGVLSRRYNIPLYANFDTWQAINEIGKIGKLKPENQCYFSNDRPFFFDDLAIQPFKISHDAACPVGFKISDGRSYLGIATDTGIITPDMRQALRDCRVVALESNHDAGMLETGPYPYYLKRRVAGSKGHLSNDVAAEFALDLVTQGTDYLVLSHLSHENNMPFLAEQTTVSLLKSNHINTKTDVHVDVAKRDALGKLIGF